jgi:hypothetical protein
MMKGTPQLSAIALLVYKFGDRIPGGGFEVHIPHAEITGMSPHGTFQEIPDPEGSGVRWQYFPNFTVDGGTAVDCPTPKEIVLLPEDPANILDDGKSP